MPSPLFHVPFVVAVAVCLLNRNSIGGEIVFFYFRVSLPADFSSTTRGDFLVAFLVDFYRFVSYRWLGVDAIKVDFLLLGLPSFSKKNSSLRPLEKMADIIGRFYRVFT